MCCTTGRCRFRRGGRQNKKAPRDGASGRRYGSDFPHVTIRDTVRLHQRLLEELGITSLAAVVGGSMGGMQALEWVIMFPHLVRRAVVIACGASQSAWQSAPHPKCQ